MSTMALVALTLAQTTPQIPTPPSEMRAIWVATVNNIDWPTSSSRTPAQCKAEAITILDKAVAVNANTIVLQVRAECDAFYKSNLEPWSRFLTGQQGRAPTDPTYDPLQHWIDEARKRGLELHAWINPYRVKVSNSTSITYASNHISVTNPGVVRTYGSYTWFDPGETMAPARFNAVVDDLVSRYDIDGIHIDDYFYPYPVSGVAFPDSSTYGAYQNSGGTLGLSDWRRRNVDNLVQGFYTRVKNAKPWVKVGISPFGIWRPGNPSGVTGLDAYASLYADSRKWLWNGWLDYISPQLYWKISATGQPYIPLLQWWTDQNLKGRHVWPGNFTSNVGSSYGDWDPQEIIDQVRATRTNPKSTGNVHFSARAIRGEWKNIGTKLFTDVYQEPAIVPASPWLDAVPPASPRPWFTRSGATTLRLNWTNRATEPVRRYVVSSLYGRNWTHKIVAPSATFLDLPIRNPNGLLKWAGIRSQDRAGVTSKAAGAMPYLGRLR